MTQQQFDEMMKTLRGIDEAVSWGLAVICVTVVGYAFIQWCIWISSF